MKKVLKNFKYIFLIFLVVFLSTITITSCSYIFHKVDVSQASLNGTIYSNSKNTHLLSFSLESCYENKNDNVNQYEYELKDNFIYFFDNGVKEKTMYFLSSKKIFDYKNREYLYRS